MAGYSLKELIPRDKGMEFELSLALDGWRVFVPVCRHANARKWVKLLFPSVGCHCEGKIRLLSLVKRICSLWPGPWRLINDLITGGAEVAGATIVLPWYRTTLRSQTGILIPYGGCMFSLLPRLNLWAGWLDANTRTQPFLASLQFRELYLPKEVGEKEASNHVRSLEAIAGLVEIWPQGNITHFRSRPSELVVPLGHANFAHHVFDELAPLWALIRRIDPSRVHAHVSREPLGPVAKIFPELGSVSRDADSEFWREHITRVADGTQRLILLRRKPFTCELRNRLLETAFQVVSPEVRSTLKALATFSGPTFWLSVKEDNRRCLNLLSIAGDLIRRLTSHFVECQLIVDGVSFPWDWRPEFGGRIFARTNLDANEKMICVILKQAPTSWQKLNLNGKSLCEAVLFANLVDIYFCHYGSQQHKVFFGGDGVGLIHGNSSVVKYRLRRTFYLRELGDWKGTLVGPDFVIPHYTCGDGRPGLRGSVDLFDYELKSEKVIRFFGRILRQIDIGREKWVKRAVVRGV